MRLDTFNKSQYFEQLQAYYCGEPQNLEQFLQDMEDSLNCHLEKHPDASTDDIYRVLGHPDELRRQYEQKRDIMRAQLRERAKKPLIAAFLAIAILVLGCFSHFAYGQIIDHYGKAQVSTYIGDENGSPVSVPAYSEKPIKHVD